MWSFSSPFRFRPGLIAAMVLGLAVSGCLRPMYGTLPGATSSVVDDLAQVQVLPIDGRVGQELRNQLIYAFSGGADTGAAPYRLSISLKEGFTDLLVQSNRDSFGRTVILDATFNLTEAESGEVVDGGTAQARASFDRGAALFANERALLDAQNRAARSLAETIRTRIAAYFAAQRQM